ncbi:tetratricopeptide repeat protein [Psychromonas sp. SA13A]|uniref:tetratricopeptide repeat protein n=1 Tax=Psychromonas sp. SA13A TaxID=2686346 RepID=UPI00140A0EC1|nr:tetratricopeptide repeat protein [Psychromonas sp. SA13A]
MQSQKMLIKLKKAQSEFQKGNYSKSVSACKKILEKEKGYVPALKLLITSLIKLNRFSEVEIALHKVIKLVNKEEAYPLLHLLGCNYISQFKYSMALGILEKLFNQTGESKVLLDIALSYFKLGNYEAARDVYFKLIELEPNNHQAKFNLYPILLHFKDYKNAWVCFHSRLQRQEIIDQVHWFAPQWNGESLVGKKILIYPEQGIGDNLSYAECFEEAISDAHETHIVCDKRLKDLYTHNFTDATILSYEDINREQSINADFDCQVLAGSLSYLYRETAESYSNQKSLRIEKGLVTEINNLLSKKNLRVGLSWFHGRRNDGNEYSMYLEELLPILKIEGIEWVNLQFGEWQDEIENMKAKHGITITHIEECSAAGDFNQYGALIANLDLVIASSNAALMFASRLGIDTWVFLPDINDEVQINSSRDPLAIKHDRAFYNGNTKTWDVVIQQFREELLSRLEKLSHKENR